MTLFNLVLVLAALGHPKADSIVNPGAAPSIDAQQMIEKVYIHTDRNCYYPGNDIWFKAYLISGSDRSLSSHSNNLHVELISPNSKIIISRVIRIEKGLGNGDMELPGNLKPGRYRLRAYTNYMRNFGDQLFFNKEIIVINSALTKDEIPDENKALKNKINLSFFPEGGSLVDNVTSIVAFKAVNAFGTGFDVSGKIYASTGELVTTFKSVHLGMGSFNFKPIPGLSYYSIMKDTTGTEIRSELPKSLPGGVALSVSINQNNELLITTKTNSQTLPLILDRDLLLTFSSRKAKLKTLNFRMKSNTNSFALPIDDLPDGIIRMTLAAQEDLPLSERLIYIQRDKDFEVNIESDKPVYKQRDSVEIRLSFPTGSDIRQDAFLSLSAVEKSSNDHTAQYPSTISSWFLLESDIRGPIEEPSYYFNPSNQDRLPDLDLLLLTQGWRDFKWKYNKGYFPPESGFTVSGRLRKYTVDKLLEAEKVNIAILENKNSLTTTVPVDSAGRFRLDGIDLDGEASLIVSAINKKGHPQGLVLLDSLKYIPEEVSDYVSPQIVLSEAVVTAFKQTYEIKETIGKKYKLSDTIHIDEISVIAAKRKNFQTNRIENSRSLYNKPDAEVIITPQFASYKNVFEILRGRVAGVIVNQGDKGYDIKIRGANSYSLTNMPLFLVDGIEKSYEEMIMLRVGLIDRIDVLKSAGETAMFGVRGANGVIAVITRTGDSLLPSQKENHSANNKISGYDAARVFYSPKHSSASDNEPDLRTTLFWEPNITLQSNHNLFLNYFNADNSSTIQVILEGITTTGIPISVRTEYEVK